jgi:hypothetical protein
MKQKDIALIILAGFISALLSYFVSNALFASPKDRRAEVEVVEPITTDFSTPDKKYFNSESVNPTQLIQIGDNPNAQPFN